MLALSGCFREDEKRVKSMKSCSETIKACGLKSTRQVADLNKVTPRTIQLLYKNDYPRFQKMVFSAIDELYKQSKETACITLQL